MLRYLLSFAAVALGLRCVGLPSVGRFPCDLSLCEFLLFNFDFFTLEDDISLSSSAYPAPCPLPYYYRSPHLHLFYSLLPPPFPHLLFRVFVRYLDFCDLQPASMLRAWYLSISQRYETVLKGVQRRSSRSICSELLCFPDRSRISLR